MISITVVVIIISFDCDYICQSCGDICQSCDICYSYGNICYNCDDIFYSCGDICLSNYDIFYSFVICYSFVSVKAVTFFMFVYLFYVDIFFSCNIICIVVMLFVLIVMIYDVVDISYRRLQLAQHSQMLDSPNRYLVWA